MAFDFSTLVTDRMQADVAAWNSKGTYNASDLNRVEAAVSDIAERFAAFGYVAPVMAKTDWIEADVPTAGQMETYRQNIATLRGVIAVITSTPEIPETMQALDYVKANHIEQILIDLDTLIIKMTQAWFFSGDLYAGET